ncbi:phosphoribosyltransferase family protein [Pseudomonas sp. QL9]|uniref:phosphoribosyltransferase family protein n=1 Tax=Pseudomonas TaxID=286 RepID=UPI001362E718|nr:phosphoribosyltransferase family protein [Pseudomonas knackmussii]
MPNEGHCLYDTTELEGILDRMALEARALLPVGRSALVGILRRGEPLARHLQQRLLEHDPALQVHALKVKRYADDLSLLHPQVHLEDNPQLASLVQAGMTLLVVDDVLYEGHSLLRTCAYLASLGAQDVRCAVLVDRHAAHQPIRADIVGIHLQVAPRDIVECRVPPYETTFAVHVLRQAAAQPAR